MLAEILISAADAIRPSGNALHGVPTRCFYREESGGVLISRILHQRMLPERHLGSEEGGV
jgi:hypothetical protein